MFAGMCKIEFKKTTNLPNFLISEVLVMNSQRWAKLIPQAKLNGDGEIKQERRTVPIIPF